MLAAQIFNEREGTHIPRRYCPMSAAPRSTLAFSPCPQCRTEMPLTQRAFEQPSDFGPRVIEERTSRGVASAVNGLHRDRARDDDHVGIARVHDRHREIAAADARRGTRVVGDLGPTLAGVIASIDTNGGGRTIRRDRRVQSRRIARRDRHVDLIDVAGRPLVRVHRDYRDLLGVAETEVRPGASGVCGLVDAVADGEVGAREPLAAAYI